MDTFLSTFVFILPGIMAYFWLQAFGLNPPVKHTSSEVSGIAALLWLPISFVVLLILNIWGKLLNPTSIFSVKTAWTVEEVNTATSDIKYLVLFLFVSFVMSFVICGLWSKWGYPYLHKLINWVRTNRNLAPLSKSSTVWDEVFLKNVTQVVQIGRIDKPDEHTIIGEIAKVSRPFETDRNLYISNISYFTSLVADYNIPISDVFFDTKSGTYINLFDMTKVKEAHKLEEEKKKEKIISPS
jgi:hypothetical protein